MILGSPNPVQNPSWRRNLNASPGGEENHGGAMSMPKKMHGE